MAICFLTCNFWSIQEISDFLILNFRTGLAGKHNRDVFMIKLINHIENGANPGIYKPRKNMLVERNDSNLKTDIATAGKRPSTFWATPLVG